MMGACASLDDLSFCGYCLSIFGMAEHERQKQISNVRKSYGTRNS